MSFELQIVVIVVMHLVMFLGFRGFFDGIASYQLNRSAYKKRRKGQTLKEWLLCSRFKNEIPKILLFLYYSTALLHICSLLACILLHFLGFGIVVGDIIARIIFCFDNGIMFILTVLFINPKLGVPDFSRWITKRRGQKPKKKK